MESHEILDSGLSSGSVLSLNSSAIEYLRQMSKWGKFLAIVGLLFSGLIILIGLAFGTIMSKLMALSPGVSAMSGSAGFAGGMGFGVGLVYAVMGLVIAYPPVRLLQFSSQAKIAVNNNDSIAVENALKRLRSIFRFYGIFTIIILSFYALALIIVLLVGGLSAFR